MSSTPASATASAAASPTGLEAVAARLVVRVDRHARAADRREVGARALAELTQAIRAAARAGRFLDPAWALDVTERALTAHLAADDAFDRHDGSCPWPWQRALQTAVSRQGTVLEDLLRALVVFAGHDLAFAATEALREAGDLTPPRGNGKRPPPTGLAPALARRRFDHDVLCDVLEAHFDALQASARLRFSRQQHLLDRAARRLDRTITLPLLRRLREQSWNWALAAAFAEGDDEPRCVRQQAASLTALEVGQVDIVRHLPLPAVRPLLWLFRPPLG